MNKSAHHPQLNDTRERILATGEMLVLVRGFSGMGLSELLSVAEVPKGSFYHYFASKEDFGVVMLERYFVAYKEQMKAHFATPETTPLTLLLSYFAGWKNIARDSQCQKLCLAVKLAAEVSDLSEAMRATLSVGMNGIVAEIAAMIERCRTESATATNAGSDQLAATLYSMWVGASLLTKVSKDMQPLEFAYQETIRQLNPS